ncbi:MAG TPA: AraC family transcriptional regulator [Ktedonobacterales bacterium]|nr:AraC family transcriptional regulator [Ktedonobacterales bacterium]
MTFLFEDRASESSYVEVIWRAQSEQPGSFMSLAASHWEMVVTKYQGQTTFTVRGPETKASPLHYQRRGVEWLGIRFKVGTFLPLLPPGKLLDRRDANLPQATRTSFWFQGSTWELPTFENADTFVEWLVREGLLVRDPVVEAVLRGQPQALSPRSVQYRFVQATGLAYKTIQQIERARRAQALLEQGGSILDAVHEVGYFDQSHLTNSLKRFLGRTPAQIAHVRQPQ